MFSARDTGSILLIVTIMISVISLTTIIVLKQALFSNKISTLHRLKQNLTDSLIQGNRSFVQSVSAGVDFASLTDHQESKQTADGLKYTQHHHYETSFIINPPMAGFSINSVFNTKLLIYDSFIISSNIKSSLTQFKFHCIAATNEIIENQINDSYYLDIDDDSIIDLEYKFNSNTGEIWQVTSQTQLLSKLPINPGQSFSRPDFLFHNTNKGYQIVLIFVMQNIATNANNAQNRLYVLVGNNLQNLNIQTPLDSGNFIDIASNPTFSIDSSYYMNLDMGQLKTVAISTYDSNIIVMTQNLTLNPDTGIPQQLNKLLHIDILDHNGMSANSILIDNSLTEINLVTHSQHQKIVNFGTELQPVLISFNGKCAIASFFEN